MAFYAVLLLLVVLRDPLSAKDDFCVQQPEALHVRIGESVIIPCTYSYPREKSPVKNISIYWRAGNGDRCANAVFIYNHAEGYTDERYKGRISLVGDERSRSGSIRVDNLRRTDADFKYCCRINVTLNNGTSIGWQNRHMTQLVFSDSPPRQLDAVPAQVGASVMIPCRVTYGEDLKPTTDLRVSWRAGYKDLCSELEYIYNAMTNYYHKDYRERIKLVSDPRGTGTSSLQIDSVQMSDSRRYCCEVHPGNGRGALVQSSHGTELIVGGVQPVPEFSVTQSNNIDAQNNETITMDCHFTRPENKDPLWIGVYWTVGEEWRTFAYHLSQESIDPEYRGRTRLVGDPEKSNSVSLQIDNVTKMDIGTYYCLVAFRFCNGNNGFTSVIHQGSGTRISIGQASQTLFLILILTIVALLLIVIILALVLKKKGLICKGASAGENPVASRTGLPLERLAHAEKDPPRPAYSNGNHKPKVEEALVYAALELPKPVHVEARAQPDPQSDTVYSAVKIK